MKSYAAIFEANGREIASYAIVADSPHRALALLDGMAWPDGADRLRILDDEGREVLAVRAPAKG